MKLGEILTLTRAVEATQIPSGMPHPLPLGSRVRISQALGGSYTVTTEFGYMVRIDARDADSLDLAAAAGSAETATAEFSEKLAGRQLRTVYDQKLTVNVDQ